MSDHLRFNFDNPERRKSFFVPIKRSNVAFLDFEAAQYTRRTLAIPYRFLDSYEVLRCTVTYIFSYPDGVLVYLMPDPKDDFKNWPIIPLWIPTSGTCGILTIWVSNAAHRRQFGQMTSSMMGIWHVTGPITNPGNVSRF